MKGMLHCVLALLALTPASADAKSFFKKIGGAVSGVVKDVGKAAETVVKAAPSVIAPVPVLGVKILKGDSVGDAVKDVAKDHVDIVIKPIETEAKVKADIVGAVTKEIGAVGKAIDIVIYPEQLQKAAIVETGGITKAVIDTGKLDVVVGAPLAIALREAYIKFQSRAKPIPEKVKFYLSTTYTSDTLNSARYAVDKDLSSLPGIINNIKERSNENHAVTVNNIIIFAKEPSNEDVWFWAHEMQHTVQYKLLGFEGFAARYTLKSGDMEAEANSIGDKALTEANTMVRMRASQAISQR